MSKKQRKRQNKRQRRKDKQSGFTKDPKRKPKKVGHGPN